MRISFVIQSLVGGGAERVLVLLANGLAGRGHNVSVITIRPEAEDAYVLDHDVRRISLHESLRTESRQTALGKNVSLLRAMRKVLKSMQPEAVISFIHMLNIRTILALMGTHIPLVVTEHTDPARSNLGAPWRIIRRMLYPQATRLVSVSRGVDNGFSWLPIARRRVIYNPIMKPAVSDSGAHELNSPRRNSTIVAMGRLAYPKGFDLLIDAFATVSPRHPDWRLVILGEGEERTRLEAQVETRNLSDKVSLPGFVSAPSEILMNSDLFVVSSRWEGFCLALGEAMAAGLPVISFDCPSGPAELICDGENGLLVEPENVDQLAHAMTRLMADSPLRAELGAQARKSIQRFDIEPILDQWEALLKSLTSIALRP